MLKTEASEKYQKTFQTKLKKLCDLYMKEKGYKPKSYAKVYSDIKDFSKRNDLSDFAFITFKNWLYEEKIPNSYYICLLCDFFGCDANYLFDVGSTDFKTGLNEFVSKADKYIYDNYGLDRKTLDFFKEYKDCGIDSSDDSDEPHLAQSSDKSFSSLFNELIHQSPWTINALLQILYAKRLDLSAYGFVDINEMIESYQDFPGISKHLVQDFDIDVAISVFSIRLKQLLMDPGYVPCKTNPLETYDDKLLAAGAVDEFISNLLSSRLKNLNSEINELTNIITKEPSK